MRSSAELTWRAAAVLLPGLAAALLVLPGCGGEPDPYAPPATREDTVLAMFALTRVNHEAEPQSLERLFGTITDEQQRAALLDAIDALAPADEIEIVETYPMDDLVRESFDLVGRLPGGGVARFSVQIDTSTEPGRIVWFSGPGVEWPARKRRGPGLSTSAPPTPPPGG
ncbi:MAG: hypothetical protein GTN89_05235 [Acidobacteria bacterium]|nr:hypothetical protein [Acidobacteriota bacterium]NIM61131.1 hypothetical protein [Acidobacteriota bacterium]NIO58721.1 hypothetical protein [Acidobacteriota bacterium]NIQ29772.1 hypothetical protein [Acidobacteriota bacterium]NIQ84492.1 hypothetical protein [Acidobacteriota bacterium]